jgi:hypothetical protein
MSISFFIIVYITFTLRHRIRRLLRPPVAEQAVKALPATIRHIANELEALGFIWWPNLFGEVQPQIGDGDVLFTGCTDSCDACQGTVYEFRIVVFAGDQKSGGLHVVRFGAACTKCHTLCRLDESRKTKVEIVWSESHDLIDFIDRMKGRSVEETLKQRKERLQSELAETEGRRDRLRSQLLSTENQLGEGSKDPPYR